MGLRLFEMQVALGGLIVLVLQVLRHGSLHGADGALLAMLEAAGFGFCCIGIISGGRGIRLKYEALGSNKSVAIANSDFMRERQRVQITAIVGTAAMASLAASRFGLNPLCSALAAFAGLASVISVINRLTGWTFVKGSRQ